MTYQTPAKSGASQPIKPATVQSDNEIHNNTIKDNDTVGVLIVMLVLMVQMARVDAAEDADVTLQVHRALYPRIAVEYHDLNTRELNDRFLEVHNKSVYAPQEKNPKGETHEDVGYFSYDAQRKRLVLRQFHVEGFVNQYVEETTAGGRLAFVSEAIENIAPGWRARESYVFEGPDAFTETFELAEPGKDFAVYTRTRFTRKKD